ncbi:MAG: aminoacyl-tRNA hydrolase [bacterium]|nr:aminoacyl-tRNA hydrolase [bacterium]
MKLIAGLGNIGNKYVFTRHNAGFMLADSIVINENDTFRENPRLKCFMTNLRLNGEDYMIIKPTTFMNLSGEAIRAVVDYYKIQISDILVVYDDISLPLGKIRLRANGSDGGHNGIKSVIQHLGTQEFARLKIGIGPQPNLPSEVFVLQNFTKEELAILKDTITTAKMAISCYFTEGIAITQNKFN